MHLLREIQVFFFISKIRKETRTFEKCGKAIRAVMTWKGGNLQNDSSHEQR